MLYREPVTKVENADVEFAAGQPVHFCPGSIGGAEWNGPGYDPPNNLVMIGQVEWCTTVTLQKQEQLKSAKLGQPWSGKASINPFNVWGKQDPFGEWAGWVYAVDADSGQWRWRAKTNYPIQSGMTPTAGGVVFFGDMGGNFYALDANDGHKLWGQKIGGAVGGGVITYMAGQSQRIAVATGLTEILWPTEITTAKVSILEVDFRVCERRLCLYECLPQSLACTAARARAGRHPDYRRDWRRDQRRCDERNESELTVSDHAPM